MDYIPAAVIIAVNLALWRHLAGEIREIRRELGRLNDRIDRHLEGHP